jgi:NADH-quinone oxidoreductase subunit L
MSNIASYLWLIPFLPLAASVLIAFFGPRLLRKNSHWPCVAAVATSCVLSIGVALSIARARSQAVSPAAPAVAQEQVATQVTTYYRWFQAGTLDIGFTLRADGLSAIMLIVITFVGGLIAIYAIGYMRGDEGYPRFFGEISLFIFSMTGLVLADNFILLYAFWEGVGLCSYLLIGFWFTRPSAAAAARKAFLVTRLGDTGMAIGILLLWSTFGRLDYDGVFPHASEHMPVLPAICLLLFCGAVGKSAQFPLHVWLPDAMEGPTPVSALIHAATMVTAGVYLVARSMPLFRLAPEVLVIVASIGAFTALLAALIAVTQNDLKRVLAYSTISQLGYMFLGLGSGTVESAVPLAVMAAIFHLVTHAFFKALLFLGAGSVMHAMGDVIDMRRIGGLRRLLPTTHWTFLCGALALSGFPLFSGFWSKDEIVARTQGAREGPYPGIYSLLLVIALVTAGLTAFYTFRAYFLTFWGEEKIPAEAGHHAHESPAVMTIPLIILAVGAIGIGFVIEPLTYAFSGLLGQTRFLGQVEHEAMNWSLMGVSGLISLAGIGIAWWMYVARPQLAALMQERFPGLLALSENRFYIDEIYGWLIVAPLSAFARICRVFDLYVVDSFVDLVGYLPGQFGKIFRPMQNGLVQFYALAMILGVTVFLIAMVRALAG